MASETETEHRGAEPDGPGSAARLSPTVRLLGLVSLCTDLSSEMVYPLNPVFLTQVLGAPAWTVGLVEGVAETTASLLKMVSGSLSDRLGRRKPFAVVGYTLGAISKPLIAISGTWGQVLGARFLDRAGKGLRAAPRDALIAENCAPSQRGRAFGLHRSMDTTGAVLGPLLGYAFLRHFPDQFRWLYTLAFIPALLGVLVLNASVKEHKSPKKGTQIEKENWLGPTSNWLGDISPDFRRYLVIVGVFALGNSSDAFLLLRAQSAGVKADQLLLLYALFNCVEASLGYAVGRLSDHLGRRHLIAAGYLVYALVYFGFARVESPTTVWILFSAYGLYYTLTQGAQKALAADLVHPEKRASQMGAFHLTIGLGALPASLMAGLLYSHASPAAPFYLGVFTATVSCTLLSSANFRISALQRP